MIEWNLSEKGRIWSSSSSRGIWNSDPSPSMTVRVSGCVFVWRGAANMQCAGPGAVAFRKPLPSISKQHFPRVQNLCSEIKIISSKARCSELDCSSRSGQDAVNLSLVSKAGSTWATEGPAPAGEEGRGGQEAPLTPDPEPRLGAHTPSSPSL